MDTDLTERHSESAYRRLSFWMDTVPERLVPRKPLPGDSDVDIAIVGAGYTGLWTAYYLAGLDPSLRIVVLEKEIAGFGASGRNGGWCSALFPASLSKVARGHGRDTAIALQRAMHETVDEVRRVCETEGIDCHYRKGGTVVAARTQAQLERARAEIAEARSFGFGEDDYRLLGTGEARGVLGATDVVGATYTPHCAAIHPARLVRGLADAVVSRGMPVYERTPALSIRDGVVETAGGRVRAEIVVRATEGYTASLPGWHRTLAPLYSLMVATEPLPPAFWEQAGLARRETFADHRHLIIYGQRTADDRLAFGGRGAPYHFGSSVRPEFDQEARVFRDLRGTLSNLFPDLADAKITHSWGGPLGVPRDWFPSVDVDRFRKLAWAGGYVGDGVGTSNLAGRTLADLILGRATDLLELPWVEHRSRSWEPEPLRWLGINLGLQAMARADAEEARTGRPSRIANTFGRLLGQ